MHRDPTEFRERFLRWRDTGESLYDAGRIRKYEDGKDPINYETLKSHSYRVPFIEDKAVRLTNAGLATGAVLSTNLLDSIADNAYVAGLPIKTALGLVTKESTLGNPTDDTSVYKILSPLNVAKFKKWGTGQNINTGMSVEEQTLVNYYKGDTDYELFNGRGNPENRQSILKTAFLFYKNHPNKYNPGQKNHTDLVLRRGEEVWDSPEVKKWYSEYKINKLINAINNSDTHKTLKNVFPTLKDLPHYEDGKDSKLAKTAGAVGEGALGLAPVIGTLMDAKEFYNNPTLENFGYMALSGIGDALMLTGIGAGLGAGAKAANAAIKSRKAIKLLQNTRHVARYSAKEAEYLRLRNKSIKNISTGLSFDVFPQTIQTGLKISSIYK